MRTILYDRHVELGAKLTEFGGWEMPLHYPGGILHEHRVVRQAVGIFDVSHMGRIPVRGSDAEFFLDYLSTNLIVGIDPGAVVYTVWCAEKGTAIDDLLVFRKSATDWFVVANASNREKDLNHMQQMKGSHNVIIGPLDEKAGILAVQGPNASRLIARLFPSVSSLKYMHFVAYMMGDAEVILSRTGYTGSPGYEIYAPEHLITNLWDTLLREGKDFGAEPVGLGARDTLRLEMGYALYGHELSDSIAPTETVSSWTVKWSKPDFLGKQALKTLSLKTTKRTSYGIVMEEKGIPRQGYSVIFKGKPIGEVSSGTYSPLLERGIALILVRGKLPIDEIVEIEIRGARVPAKITALPFVNCSPV